MTLDAGPRARRAPWPVRAARGGGLALLAALVGLGAWGFAYYAAPLAVRVRSQLHPWLRPSGVVGQSLGLLALALFLFLWLYPMRKRLGRRADFAGAVGHWLDVHVVAGLLLPLVAAAHAGFRFTGLIGLGYGAMFVVCLSGVAGRYIYVHIPRGRSGLELGREELAAERRTLVLEIAQTLGLPVPVVESRLALGSAGSSHGSIPAVLFGMLRDDLARRHSVRTLAREWRRNVGTEIDRSSLRRVLRLARREIGLGQQARMLDGIQRIFRYWHAAHKPFAITALVAVFLHVGVVVALGATWLW